MSRILILSGLQISTNPRVWKEAATLSDAGHEVEVVGATLEPWLAERDQSLVASAGWSYTSLVNAGAGNWHSRVRWTFARVRRRAFRTFYRVFGLATSRQGGYVAPEMLRHALHRRADLTILHSPQALWAGAELLRRGHNVGVDIEDWYSEDFQAEDRRNHPGPAMRRLERRLLRGAAYSSTTSESLSNALAEAYECAAPAVIYNAFPWKEREAMDGARRDRVDHSAPSVCWFSQTVGPGRGLETWMCSLHHARAEYEIHIRGTGSAHYIDGLRRLAPAGWQGRIFFHPQAPHAELLSRLAEHDIGFAGDLPRCLSRDLTVTNKILQYLLAGNAVVASSTGGHREVASMAPGAVTLFEAGNPLSLASVVDGLLMDRDALHKARSEALDAAARTFSWERCEPVLLSVVENAISRGSTST